MELKKAAALAAIDKVKGHSVIGVGTGSTVNFFIEALLGIKSSVDLTVSSSDETTRRLKLHGFQVVDLNYVGSVPIYVDGADEINKHMQMIKGGGGALVREKILATASTHFICIADESKYVDMLGEFPVAVAIVPMARGLVARQIVAMGGDPVYRENVTTDDGLHILDVHNLDLTDPVSLEKSLNAIPGVVDNGVFSSRRADSLLLATKTGVVEHYL